MKPETAAHLVGCAVILSLVLSGCAPAAKTSRHPKVIKAMALEKKGDLDAALAALDQAVLEDPRDAVAWNNRGHIYFQKGLLDRAIDDFTRAIAIQETGLRYANRGDAKSLKGLYDEALADYTKALELGDERAHVYVNRGAAYFHLGRYAESVADFTRAIDRDPNDVRAYGGRGLAQAYLAQYQAALADFDRYLLSAPDDIRAVRWQGEAFLRTGRIDRAKENVRKLIELEPRLAVNFSGDRALDLYDLEKRRTMAKRALAAAQEAASTGQWPNAFQQYERAYAWMTGETEKDRADVAAIIEGLRRTYAKLATKPELPEAARRFGVQAVSWAEQKQYDQAVDRYAHALSVAYWWPEGHFNRALLLADRNRFAEAIMEMNAFLELAPASPDARAAQDKIYEWELKAK